MAKRVTRSKVGDLRPSQLLYTFGIGAIVDLPNLSVMVMGIEDWDTSHMTPIAEDRLLSAVRKELGAQVESLCLPPIPEQSSLSWGNPFDEGAGVGAPVTTFPRWVRCPQCDLLAPLDCGLFELKTQPFRPDRARYEHINCNKASKPPAVLPARFLVACENGHLDDFPWIDYVHKGKPCDTPCLRLREWGVSGTVSEVNVSCDSCGAQRRMRDAFFGEDRSVMPACAGRRPHLRDHEEKQCQRRMQPILLGASNSWFPITLSSLYIPGGSDELVNLVEEHWLNLKPIVTQEILAAFRQTDYLRPFAKFTDADIWTAVEERRNADAAEAGESATDLKTPEWEAFSNPATAGEASDFKLVEVKTPAGLQDKISRVVKVEKIREVRALIGFTRIESPGDLDEIGSIPEDKRAPLSRRSALWTPAAEVRGEGIFIQFDERAIVQWAERNKKRDAEFFQAHKSWRKARNIEPAEDQYPGMRYILLHSFTHALMRQITLDCGYSAASIRERIYSRNPDKDKGPMAGVLLYTGASDSDGTLGGLASLAEPEILGQHIAQALESIRICSSDPLCGEHHPFVEGNILHGAACHACLFSAETSCERGNKYIDRGALVETSGADTVPFF